MAITPPAPEDPFGSARTASGAQVAPASGDGPPSWPVPLFIVLTVAAVVFGFSTVEAPPEAARSATPVPIDVEPDPGGPDATATPGQAAPPAPSGGLGDGGSLWKPSNLRVALAEMSRAARARRIGSLRVDTDYLVAEYVRGKQRVNVYANRDGRVQALSSRIGSPTDRSIAVHRIDPAVPERIARRIARRARVGVSKVDYLVLSIATGEVPQWIGFLDQETDYDRQLNPFFAALDGSGVRPAGSRSR